MGTIPAVMVAPVLDLGRGRAPGPAGGCHPCPCVWGRRGWRGQFGDIDMGEGCSDWSGDIAEWKDDQSNLGTQLGWRDAQDVWGQ